MSRRHPVFRFLTSILFWALIFPAILFAVGVWIWSSLEVVKDRVVMGEMGDLRDEAKYKAKLVQQELEQFQLLVEELQENQIFAQLLSPNPADFDAHLPEVKQEFEEILSDERILQFRKRNFVYRRGVDLFWENPYLECRVVDATGVTRLAYRRQAQDQDLRPDKRHPVQLNAATLKKLDCHEEFVRPEGNLSGGRNLVHITEPVFESDPDPARRRPIVWGLAAIRGTSQTRGPAKRLGYVAVKFNLAPLLEEVEASARHLIFIVDDQGKCLTSPNHPAWKAPAAVEGERISKFLGAITEKYPGQEPTHPFADNTALQTLSEIRSKTYGMGGIDKAIAIPDVERFFVVARLRSSSELEKFAVGFCQQPENVPAFENFKKVLAERGGENFAVEFASPEVAFFRYDLNRRLHHYNGLQSSAAGSPPAATATKEVVRIPVDIGLTGTRFVISASTKEQLQEIVQKELSKPPFRDASVTSPQPLDQFAAHYERVPLPSMRGERERFLGLVLAASYTEIENDISESLKGPKGGTFALFGLTCLLTGLTIFFVILPLRKLRSVTQRMGEDRQDTVDVRDDIEQLVLIGGFQEVADLATSFDGMATQLAIRDRRVRQELDQRKAIVSLAAEGIVTFDETGRIITFNRAAEIIFGYSPREIEGQPLATLFPKPSANSRLDDTARQVMKDEHFRLVDMPLLREHVDDLTQSATSTTSRSTSLKMAFRCMSLGGTKSGDLFPCELAASRLRLLDDTPLFTMVVREISEQLKSQESIRRLYGDLQHRLEEIRQLNDALEAKVKGRTAELSVANEELRRTVNELVLARDQAYAASKSMSAFLAKMSHELRTPLNAIIGFSEMLTEDAQAAGDESTVKDLHRIHTAGKYLLGLINDILDISKAQAGAIKFQNEPFQIRELVADVTSMIQPLAEKNGNSLVTDVPADIGTMLADRKRVTQVVVNLLSNACKFTNQGTVTLSIYPEISPTTDEIVIQVRDTGIGIPPDKVPELFQEFYQVDDSSTRKHEGTGLGLAIVKRFSEAMGGSVEVTSEAGKGSVFTVRLPRESRETIPGEKRSAEVPKDGGFVTAFAPDGEVHPRKMGSEDRLPVVLVIDDDERQHDLMRRQLAKSGMQVECELSGEGGLAKARELVPDVILLDVLMPGIDGWEVLHQLKNDPKTAGIPVILVSMLPDEGRGFQLGAVDYIVKPVNRERLMGVLNRYRCGQGLGSILVVEDDDAQRQMIRQMLEREGWKVDAAENGQVALARLEASTPVLILLDLLMPVMNGFELLRELEQRPEWRSIPVVVVTSYDLDEATRQRLNGNVEQVLQKGSYQREELLELICQRVGHRVAQE